MFLRSKHSVLIQRCIARCVSDCTTFSGTDLTASVEVESDANGGVVGNNRNKRLLKVAILGTPNAGKSTLINKIIGHPVFSVSKKVHTTRKRARAAVTRDNAQIVFVDTPGLVSAAEVKRHHLEDYFVHDGLRAVKESHLVGIVHDVGNPWTRDRLDAKILNILKKMECNKKAILILNKVDIVKKKDILLDLITKLTNSGKLDVELDKLSPQPGETVKKPRREQLIGWPNFAEVFLVSALSGDGVPQILDYLLKAAEEGKWPLPPGQITDQKYHKTIEELIRGRLLDVLPKEVPYNLTVETEYFHINDLGEIIAVVLVVCPLERHRKMLIAGGGRIVKKVATEAEADARDALRTHVRLRISVCIAQEINVSMKRQKN